MNVDWIRETCLSFPGATEQIQWGDDLLFKVGGKMFAATPLALAPVCLSFKASPENFAELTERPNIIPAPYLARARWVALETRDALGAQELATLLRESYELVLAKLSKKRRESLSSASPIKGMRKQPKLRGRKIDRRNKAGGESRVRKVAVISGARIVKRFRSYLSSRYPSGTSSSGTSWVVTSSSSA
jgi:predicted DNA-binding protein (MmcQ/YjbR family)